MGMNVTVRLFGGFRKYGDGRELSMRLNGPVTLAELKGAFVAALQERHPGFNEASLVGDSAFADENAVLSDDAVITRDCTVAVLPPVCGG